MSEYATVAELEVRLEVEVGSLTGTKLARAHAAIEDASNLVDAHVTVTDPPSAVVRTVVLKAAKRAYDNPDGFVSETIGDYTYRRTFAQADSLDSGVYLTEAEVTLLKGGVPRPKARSLTLRSNAD